MWDSVLLDDKLALALLKAGVTSGQIVLTSPTTDSEQIQLADIRSTINRSRSVQTALTYCLLSDRIYIDPTHLGWDIYAELDTDPDSDNFDVGRPFIEKISPELSSIIEQTDSGLNYISSGAYQADPIERANLFASLEPLIWRSYRRNKSGLSRSLLRDSLDLIVLEPQLIEYHKEFGTSKFNSAVRKVAAERWSHIKLTDEYLRYLVAVCYVTITKGHVAANKITEAEKRNAIYPVTDLSFGPNRYRKHAEHFPAIKSDEIIAAARIFLDEVKYWPVLNSLTDVMQTREKEAFKQFRDMLRRWVNALMACDEKEEQLIRTEIRKANNSLRRSCQCSEIGRFFTYIGLPLMVLDAFTVPVFGTPMSIAGFGLQAYSDWKKRESRWIMIGN